ncbi:hypothetical protein [Persephonella sp.]
MKKIILSIVAISLISGSSFAITKEEAKKLIENYVKGSSYTSEISVCENDKYFVGQVYLRGYEGVNVIRKIYVSKKTGGLYPTMAETYDYCYMMEE